MTPMRKQLVRDFVPGRMLSATKGLVYDDKDFEQVETDTPAFYNLLASTLVQEAQEFQRAVRYAAAQDLTFSEEKSALANVIEILNSIMDYRNFKKDEIDGELKSKARLEGKYTQGFVVTSADLKTE